MGVSPACIAAVKTASGGRFDDAEATQLIQRMEARRAAEEAAGNLDNLDARLRAAAAQEAEQARIAAALRVKQAALGAIAFDRALTHIETLTGAGLDRRKAFLAFLEGSTRDVAGGRASLAATAMAYRARYMEAFNLAAVRDPLTARLIQDGDPKLAADTVREMRELRDGGAPGATRNPQAQQLAKLYAEISERIRGDLNRHGAPIGRLDGWSPQAHATDRVVQVSREEWGAFILPRLDREKTFPGMSDEGVAQQLRDIHQAIVTGVDRNGLAAEDTGRVNAANLANSMARNRVLHFRDADAWLSYAERFGAGNIHDAMLAHINTAAKAAAQLERLGPNPENTLVKLRARLAREAAGDLTMPPRKRQAMVRALDPNNADGSIGSAWAEVSGLTSAPVNIRAAQIGTMARAWQSWAKLGGAVVSSLSDLATRAAALTAQGRPIGSAWAETFGQLMQGRGAGEQREIAAILDASLDGMKGHITAAGLAEDMPLGKVHRLNALFFTWQGMSYWSDMAKAGSARGLSAWMGENAGRAHNQLPRRYQAILRQQGISPADWEAIRATAWKAEDGRTYVTPDRLAALPRQVLARLAQQDLETLQAGLADRIARRAQADATEAGWVTRRTEAIAASLQRQLANLQRTNAAAADGADRQVAGLRERIGMLDLRLSELAEFHQAVAEGRAWTPAADELAEAAAPDSSNTILSAEAATGGAGRTFSPRAERYLDAGDPAALAARAEGELRTRLDALRRAIGNVNRQVGRGEQRRLAEVTSWWNAAQQQLDEFTTRMEARADARRQATEAERGDWDNRVTRILEDTRTGLELRLRRFFADEMGFAFLETDAASRRLALQGTRPGTVTGETMRALMQFKGFPIAFTQRVLGRALLGYGPQERGLQARNLGVMLGGLVAMGYLAMTAKDFLRGYTPRDPTKPDTWLAALLQSGGAGIYGDFLFAQANRFGTGALGTAAGPLAGTAGSVVDLWTKARSGEATGGEALSLALQNTPFLSLWYARPVLDFLALNAMREALSPGFMARQERRRREDFGQERLLPATLF
jgi:hypothetical protein